MSTPHPELDPAAERVLSYGLPTGPLAEVLETPYAETKRFDDKENKHRNN